MIKLYLLVIVLFIMFGVPMSGYAVPVYNPTTGHMYEIVNGNWDAAEHKAITLGGHLVTINDQAEQTWLINTFGSNTYYWIGLNDVTSDNHYEWTSGEPVTFTNWERADDNNSDWFDWISMNYGGPGIWNYFCLNCASYGIAECQTNSVPEPGTLILMGTGITAIGIWGKRSELKSELNL